MKVKFFKIRIAEEFLAKDQKSLNDFLQICTVLKHESAFVQDKEPYWSVILYYNEAENLKENEAVDYNADPEILTADEVKILESLKLWRSEKARSQNLPAYFIATNKELLSLTKFKPVNINDFKEIKGFGKHKIDNYSTEILGILENV